MDRFWDPSVRTKVKICGVTELGFAYDCYELGIDALGFHIWNRDIETSVWQHKIESFSRITEHLPADLSLFLLVNFNDAAKIISILNTCHFDTLQIHAYFPQEEHDALISKIREANNKVRIVTVVSMASKKSGRGAMELALQRSNTSDGILLDSGWKGGSGVAHDWYESKQIRDNLNIPFILAGGINCYNICEAISIVRPYAVDIETGANRTIKQNDLNIQIKSILRVQKIVESLKLVSKTTDR